MRWITISLLGAAAAVAGCGDESDSGSGAGGSSGMTGPTITMVAWTTTPSCTPGETSEYTVSITAVDPDDDASDLIYNGSVGGCTGDIDGAASVIDCPNFAPYPGTVMVSDPDGNESNPVAFEIGVCDSSSCTTDPNTCG